MVVRGVFEPPMFTTWVAVLQTALFGQLQKPHDGSCGRIRTCDLVINSHLNYRCSTHESKTFPIPLLRRPLRPLERTSADAEKHQLFLRPACGAPTRISANCARHGDWATMSALLIFFRFSRIKVESLHGAKTI